MRKKLTDNFIRTRKPAPKGKRIDIMDVDCPKLGLRVTDRGHKSFVYHARFPGSTNMTRRAIGDYPVTTLAQARAKARQWDALLADGIDPAVEVDRKRAEREAVDRAAKLADKGTFAHHAREYLRTHCKHHRQALETGRLVEKELLPAWGGREITSITPDEIKEHIRVIAKRSPSVARNVLTLCKSFFDWCLEEKSPAAVLKPKRLIGVKKPRQRILTDDEISALWDATGLIGYPYGHLYRLLLLTGVRLREAANAKWSEISGDTWSIPPERFKSDSVHIVPLSGAAQALLAELPRKGDFLFTFSGTSAVNSFSKSKARLDVIMRTSAWRVHDLRRVVRSKLASLKVPDHIAEQCLGHGRRGLQRVYDLHSYQDEMRFAFEQWAALLAEIAPPPPAPSNVVRIRKRGKAA